LINREDRWANILTSLKEGANYGVEKPKRGKNSVFVTILGRKMNSNEASSLSGIHPSFFKNYQDKEVPVSAIIQRLDNKWIREKMNKLKQGLE
jgi:hypothetical protein